MRSAFPWREEKAPAEARAWILIESTKTIYFFAVSAFAASALAASDLAYLRRKRSTRPAVSSSFCLPVKNGWQAAQISTLMSPLWVGGSVKVLPHAQCTRTSL